MYVPHILHVTKSLTKEDYDSTMSVLAAVGSPNLLFRIPSAAVQYIILFCLKAKSDSHRLIDICVTMYVGTV